MYYPYLRGKQFELLLVRENVALIKENDIHPIIEPVNTNFKAIGRALNELNKLEVEYVLIINPKEGENPVRQDDILSKLYEVFIRDHKNVRMGYIVDAKSDIDSMTKVLDKYIEMPFSIIHYGYPNGKELAKILSGYENIQENIFIETYARKLYQKSIKRDSVKNILIRDGFKRQKKNALYPESEHFSDLPATYTDESMDDFGDFLIVGDDYSESGGPAWAVAIHLTYIGNDDAMYIYHFVSDQTNSPTDPGGKFFEALSKLVAKVSEKNSPISKTEACKEFQALHRKGHYPGLGYVKKLSMKHHLELIAGL